MIEFFPDVEVGDKRLYVSRAAVEDAAAIMEIKRAAWLDAYPDAGHGVTTEDIQKKMSDEVVRIGTENWQKGIANEANDPNRVTFVAHLEDDVVGFVAPSIENGRHMISGLYVHPDAQGHGIGSTLLQKGLDWHGADQDVYLEVVSYNHRAISFYEDFGFQETGVELPADFDQTQGIKLLPEIEMMRKAT